MNSKTYSHEFRGKTILVELTNWAEQANGSVVARIGDTLVLATAVMNPVARDGSDFFPLTVDYEEKFYATGRILGSRFMKRETRPSEEAVLVSRLIDRAIRPRFNMQMRNEVQVVITVLSIDDQNDPDILSLFAASLALSLSNIPWSGPIAGVRIGRKNGEFLANPIYTDRETSDMDVVVTGTKDRINMIEAGAQEISESDFAASLDWGFNLIKELIAFQESIIQENPPKKLIPQLLVLSQELRELIRKDFSSRIEEKLYSLAGSSEFGRRKGAYNAVQLVREEWFKTAAESFPELFQKGAANYLFEEEINAIIHRRIIEKGERPDGRKPDEVRELSASVGLLPRVHGSGLFMRGETHVLSTLTLGSPGDQQIVEGMEIRTKKRFLHHYNFPPFSTGETKPMRGPGRREIGHGALAGKALLPLIPSVEDFPYTIRIVSEVLSSNGSSSMASVCGSILALMDAGVPVKKSAAGAAMGLMLDEKGNYKVLTDIQGPEDHHGDMDFKVAGTKDGITAVQMDVKIDGITPQIIRDTLAQALRSRLHILSIMEAVISEPRPELSQWAPRIITLKINPEKIGALIGPGGKMINSIIDQTKAQIDIEDDGTVFVTSESAEGMERALALIKQATREVKAGELLEGKVTRILDFGAMVEVGPRQDGLIHVSELAPWHVERVTDILKIGDIITVMVKNIDEQGRINLSLKDVPGRYSDVEIERGRQERAKTPAPRRDDRPRRPHSFR